MPITYSDKTTGDTFSGTEATEVKNVVNQNETDIATNAAAITGKANTSHTHTAIDVTDFDTEVSNNATVTANAAASHSHANKSLLDTYTQTEANLSSAVTLKHAANADTILDEGGGDETSANEIRTHIDDDDLHRTINDASQATTFLLSASKVADKVGTIFVSLSDTALSYSPAAHNNVVILCATPTADRIIDIDSAVVTRDDTFKVLAKTDSGFVYKISGSTSMGLYGFDGATLANPYTLEDGMYLVHIDDTNDRAYIQKYGSGSGGGSVNGAYLRSTDTSTNYNSATPAALALDVEDVADANIEHDTVTNNSRFGFVAGVAGRAAITVGIYFLVAPTRGNITIQLRKNGTTYYTPSPVDGYSRQSSPSFSTGAHAFFYIDVADGDYFEVMLSEGETSGTINLDGVNSFVLIEQRSELAIQTITGGEVTDSSFRIVDDGVSTKKIAFEASGISSSTTRTITMPDADVSLADIATNTAAIAAITSFDPGTYAASSSYHANTSGAVDTRLDEANEVYFRGSVTATGGITASTTLFQIANTPTTAQRIPIMWYDSSITTYSTINSIISIDTSGNVSLNFAIAVNDIVYFNHLRFHDA